MQIFSLAWKKAKTLKKEKCSPLFHNDLVKKNTSFKTSFKLQITSFLLVYTKNLNRHLFVMLSIPIRIPDLKYRLKFRSRNQGFFTFFVLWNSNVQNGLDWPLKCPNMLLSNPQIPVKEVEKCTIYKPQLRTLDIYTVSLKGVW